MNLKQLIETTYLENGKKKVILISHSMGSLYAMNLLNLKVDEDWKKRYISTWFAISSPWTGSIRAVKTMVTGDNMGIFLFNDKRFKDMERTFPGIAFLLPNPAKFGATSYDAPVVSFVFCLSDFQTSSDCQIGTNELSSFQATRLIPPVHLNSLR